MKTSKVAQVVELVPMFDTNKSFYGKAFVQRTKAGNVLYSYATPVAVVSHDRVVITNNLKDLTNTTVRHIREFLFQYAGVSRCSKQQLIKKYGSYIDLN